MNKPIMIAKRERIEARFLPEVKRMAERAALLKGITLTDYLAKLVCEDAPKTLKFHNEITLSNQQFDNFLQVCEDEASYELSDEIKQAASRLDKEGF